LNKKRKDHLFSPRQLRTLREKGLGDDCQELAEYFLSSVGRINKSVTFGDLASITEKRRASLTIDSLCQTSLIRSINLVKGFATLLGNNNTHSLALIVRGHLETTALLGFLCDQLIAHQENRLSFDGFHDKIAAIMLGHSGSDFEKAPKPINVMTMIEKADRHLKATTEGKCIEVISDSYAWLSNFGHPNFLSNAATFRIDSAAGVFKFGDNNGLKDTDKELMKYLLLSSSLQSAFFDSLEEVRLRVGL
jgi:hypothetical protein